jgi:hypothetical protein
VDGASHFELGNRLSLQYFIHDTLARHRSVSMDKHGHGSYQNEKVLFYFFLKRQEFKSI